SISWKGTNEVYLQGTRASEPDAASGRRLLRLRQLPGQGRAAGSPHARAARDLLLLHGPCLSQRERYEDRALALSLALPRARAGIPESPCALARRRGPAGRKATL